MSNFRSHQELFVTKFLVQESSGYKWDKLKYHIKLWVFGRNEENKSPSTILFHFQNVSNSSPFGFTISHLEHCNYITQSLSEYYMTGTVESLQYMVGPINSRINYSQHFQGEIVKKKYTRDGQNDTRANIRQNCADLSTTRS